MGKNQSRFSKKIIECEDISYITGTVLQIKDVDVFLKIMYVKCENNNNFVIRIRLDGLSSQGKRAVNSLYEGQSIHCQFKQLDGECGKYVSMIDHTPLYV